MDHLSAIVSNNALEGLDPAEVLPAYQWQRTYNHAQKWV